MAWLGVDALPMVHGWPGPPQLQAGNIGGLVGNILQNRLDQQKFQQAQIAQAVKDIQSQRSAQAYIQGAQNYRLLPQGMDLSGLSAHDAQALAQQIQDQTPDTESDNLKNAMAANYWRLATGAGGGSDGDGGSTDTGGPEIVEKDGIKYLVNRTSKSVTYRRLPGQWGATRTETENTAPTMDQQTVYPNDPSAQPGATATPNPDVTITPPPSRVPSNAATGAPVNTPAPVKPVTPGEQIDPATVHLYILKHNGDVNAARQDARADGWSF